MPAYDYLPTVIFGMAYPMSLYEVLKRLVGRVCKLCLENIYEDRKQHLGADSVSALLLAAWALVACLFLTESPQGHRFVSDAEKHYLAAQPQMQKTEEEKVN